MAKIDAWEGKVRAHMNRFARDVNRALGYAIHLHNASHRYDPERVSLLGFDDVKWPEKLAKPAKKIARVSVAIKRAIRAEEDGDQQAFDNAMQPIIELTNRIHVWLEWTRSEGKYQLQRNHEGPEEEYPFYASLLVLDFDDYLRQYNEFLHLGICRQCAKLYLKPKHGAKSRYCSRACGQKAYRERKKEAEK